MTDVSGTSVISFPCSVWVRQAALWQPLYLGQEMACPVGVVSGSVWLPGAWKLWFNQKEVGRRHSLKITGDQLHTVQSGVTKFYEGTCSTHILEYQVAGLKLEVSSLQVNLAKAQREVDSQDLRICQITASKEQTGLKHLSSKLAQSWLVPTLSREYCSRFFNPNCRAGAIATVGYTSDIGGTKLP